MAVELEHRKDFLLENYARVAWFGESVTAGANALATIDHSRHRFMDLLDNDSSVTIYGVTSGYGQNASVRLTPEERAEHAATPPFTSMAGFGGDLPERVKRGIVFARLVNFIEGHAAVSSELVRAVCATLDEKLPNVPLYGNASAGEIVPLSHLFTPMTQSLDLAEKETLALINGSPCASALLADVALATERRIELVLDVFALSVEALAAPLEAYDEALEALYGDPYVAHALQQIRARVGVTAGAANVAGTTNEPRRPYQAPVSWRILPQVLGQLYRAHAQLCEVATISLQAITDNPVVVAGASDQPRVLSNGGYHNGAACAAIDAVNGSFSDLATLADRHVSKLFDGSVSLLPAQLKYEGSNGYLGCLGFIAADYAEQARASAQRTPLIGSEGGGFGQNDVLIPVFQAWRSHTDAARSLDACLAILAVTCSQAFSVSARMPASETLSTLLEQVRFHMPPVKTARAVGPSVGALAQLFTERVFSGCSSEESHDSKA